MARPPTKPKNLPARDLRAVYRVRCAPDEIDGRAHDIAVEQSVEMPLDAIDDDFVRSHIVGRVERITDCADGTFSVDVALSPQTVGGDAGQLLNVLFGNTSIHDDVVLEDVIFPPAMAVRFGGPNVGAAGLRERARAGRRALTCSALKPQGLPATKLAELAGRLALGGLDYIKDDHGLADQGFSPFVERVAAISMAIAEANASTGRACQYVPSLNGTLDDMRRQIAFARDHGVGTFLVAPMIAGVATFQALVRTHPDTAFLTHPALAGASRIAPPLHFGKLFRMLGGDGLVFPNYGGRFGYSAATCRAIASEAIAAFDGLRPAMPVPAGGMTPERVPELLSCYGQDAMLLIGGGLLAAREHMTAATAAFVRAVEEFPYDA